MTTGQRPTAYDVSAATVHQALVARGRVMRVVDHEQRAGEELAEHCGFPLPEYESHVDQCGSQWTNYIARVLVRPFGKRGGRGEQPTQFGASSPPGRIRRGGYATPAGPSPRRFIRVVLDTAEPTTSVISPTMTVEPAAPEQENEYHDSQNK